MQIICTSLQTDNHASTSSLIFYRPDALLTPNRQCQSTEGDLIVWHKTLNASSNIIHARDYAKRNQYTCGLQEDKLLLLLKCRISSKFTANSKKVVQFIDSIATAKQLHNLLCWKHNGIRTDYQNHWHQTTYKMVVHTPYRFNAKNITLWMSPYRAYPI